MDPFDSLGGHYGLQTASEVRSDLRFEISDLNYIHIHVHIAYMFWTHFEGFLVASEATTASKRRPIWAPPGGKVAMTYLDHAPKYQPNRPTNN